MCTMNMYNKFCIYMDSVSAVTCQSKHKTIFIIGDIRMKKAYMDGIQVKITQMPDVSLDEPRVVHINSIETITAVIGDNDFDVFKIWERKNWGCFLGRCVSRYGIRKIKIK